MGTQAARRWSGGDCGQFGTLPVARIIGANQLSLGDGRPRRREISGSLQVTGQVSGLELPRITPYKATRDDIRDSLVQFRLGDMERARRGIRLALFENYRT